MPAILRFAQYFGFIFTEFSNILLLYLIATKASMRFGSYKYLMLSYAVYSMVYGLVEICTQPIIHVSGASMYLYVDSFLKHEKSISNPLASAYCASFGLCVSLLATHFVYRYFAVCRPHNLRHFDGWNLLRIYVIPGSVSVFWYWIYVFFLGPSDAKNNFIRTEIKSLYNEDIGQVGYIAFLYYYTDKTGNFVINWADFIFCCIPCGVMNTCILTMVACGWKTFQKMKNVKKSMSKRTKDLNNQLFRALVLQTLVPMCTMFAPVGSLLILPIFSIGVPPTLANAPSFFACLYPALDATIAIFMIRDFRDTVLCRKRVCQINASTVSGKHLSSYVSG